MASPSSAYHPATHSYDRRRPSVATYSCRRSGHLVAQAPAPLPVGPCAIINESGLAMQDKHTLWVFNAAVTYLRCLALLHRARSILAMPARPFRADPLCAVPVLACPANPRLSRPSRNVPRLACIATPDPAQPCLFKPRLSCHSTPIRAGVFRPYPAESVRTAHTGPPHACPALPDPVSPRRSWPCYAMPALPLLARPCRNKPRLSTPAMTGHVPPVPAQPSLSCPGPPNLYPANLSFCARFIAAITSANSERCRYLASNRRISSSASLRSCER